MSNYKPKIAIIHDHLGFRGGGERTVLLLALHLSADFITAYADKNTYPKYQKRLGNKLKILSKKVIMTRVVRFFWLRNLFWRNRNLFKKYDILIASSQTATEAVAHYSRKKALRMVYTHTTPRRVFDLYEQSKNMYPFFLRGTYAFFAGYWKRRYLKAIKKFNINIANSNNVRKRIKAHTKSDANLVAWPPIEIDKFVWQGQGDYYLSFGRVDEAKRIDKIVEAFQKMPDKKLMIASGGPCLEMVKKKAEGYDNIKIIGWVSDEELVRLVGNCIATIYIPIDEDAGMSHLESNVAGKPFLGVKEGGLIESSIQGETGILLSKNPQVSDIIKGISKMTKEWCLSKKEICEKYARKYSKDNFFRKIDRIIEKNNPQKPVIGIDASRLEDPRFPGQHKRTGVEMVSYHLIKTLAESLKNKNVCIRLYTPRTIQSLPLDIQKVIPGKRNWTRKHLNIELKNSPVDIFFTPAYYIPKNAPEKSFSIIHDVIFKTNPSLYSLKERLRQKIVTHLNIKRSQNIFTVSEFSKKEILKEYNLQDNKVISFPMGYHCHRECSETTPFDKKNQILYIGRIEKKKSVDVLVKAFAKFLENNNGWKLVLAGGNGGAKAEIEELINKLNINNAVVMPGFVSEEQKWRLLKESSLFVHPSEHEGSSLPILEAFDAGVPVIATDTQSIKEVGENAVEYFKAGDVGNLVEKMENVFLDVKKQEGVIKKGREVLKGRSWDKIADMILKEIL